MQVPNRQWWSSMWLQIYKKKRKKENEEDSWPRPSTTDDRPRRRRRGGIVTRYLVVFTTDSAEDQCEKGWKWRQKRQETTTSWHTGAATFLHANSCGDPAARGRAGAATVLPITFARCAPSYGVRPCRRRCSWTADSFHGTRRTPFPRPVVGQNIRFEPSSRVDIANLSSSRRRRDPSRILADDASSSIVHTGEDAASNVQQRGKLLRNGELFKRWI